MVKKILKAFLVNAIVIALAVWMFFYTSINHTVIVLVNGIALILFNVLLFKNKGKILFWLELIYTLAILIGTGLILELIFLLYFYVYLSWLQHLNDFVVALIVLAIPVLIIPLFFKSKRKLVWKISLCYVLLTAIVTGINVGYLKYDESKIVKTDIDINIAEYMPFDSKSKIVTLEKEASLKLEDNLPILDGAAAVFPVYSAFINAVYPSNVEFNKEPFYYSNTRMGYQCLARKERDIFFGAYPSKEQIEYATKNGTEFEYTEIGKEGFVFFVNKDNPVDNLTTQQVKDIYSGKITNWKDVGGKDEKILAFQRNEGSGSQSMLIRFMGDTPIMEARAEESVGAMGGIARKVADYRNYNNSIGFSFRYYMEGIIKDSNIKLLSIDGVKPTTENISNGTYGITTALYAVTYKGNTNENVSKLIDWILSEEGQEIIEKTGYARAMESSNTNIQDNIVKLDYDESRVKKIDETKEIVYTAYEEQIQPLDGDSFTGIHRFPYINIDSKDVIKINEDISKIINAYKEYYDTETDYIYALNNNVLSVVIIYDEDYGSAYANIEVYNIDIYTGKKLNSKEMLEASNINVSEIENKLEEAYNKVFMNYWIPVSLRDDLIENKKLPSDIERIQLLNYAYDSFCKNYIKLSIEDNVLYLDKNNNVILTVTFYNPVGAVMDRVDTINITELLKNREYIFENSDKELITSFYDYTNKELNIAYNEIFARHGHDFKNKELKEYFNSLPWYKAITDKVVSLDDLNEIEKQNVENIKHEIEERKQDREYLLNEWEMST